MILQELTKYYDRLPNAAPEGFEKRGIPFLVVLGRDGTFKALEDTQTPDGRWMVARPFTVPKDETRTSGDAPHLLWGSPEYIFGRPKSEPGSPPSKLSKRADRRHLKFVDRVRGILPKSVADEGVAAVLSFLEAGDFTDVFRDPRWMEVERSGANLAFKLDSVLGLVCERSAVVRAHAEEVARSGLENMQQCLVTGIVGAVARKHTAITGVRGAKRSGGFIVSFNQSAFTSQGKRQGYNAPVGRKAEHAYTTALKMLLARDSGQNVLIGDATVVFWAEKSHPMETYFSDFFGMLPKGVSLQDTEAIRALYRAPETGAIPLFEDETKFYVLGLAPNPNTPRLAVRFWHAGTVANVAQSIKQHFEDCSIVHRDAEPEHLTLATLLRSTAFDGKDERIQPNLAGDVMRTILDGRIPYPATLLSSVIRRIKAEQSRKKNGRSVPNVTHARAALIKACLSRDARYFKRNQQEVGMALDPSNTNIGYRLGRLFAVLEKLQEESAFPARLNATIRDRFYGAASSTPVIGFFVPMKLKNHHSAKLAKRDRGLAIAREKLIDEVMDGLPADAPFPSHLSLPDQGRFAVGYYHQRHALFTKKSVTQGEDTNV